MNRQEAGAIPHLLVAPKLGPQLPTLGATSTRDIPPRRSEKKLDEYDEEEEEYDSEENTDIENSENFEKTQGKDKPLDYSIYHNGLSEIRGYYQDGAFTAVPDAWLQENEDEDDGYWAQDVHFTSINDETAIAQLSPSVPSARVRENFLLSLSYFASLVDRFKVLRMQLQKEPPEAAIIALPSTHPRVVEQFSGSSGAFGRWHYLVKVTDPLPAQVASFAKSEIIRLLRVLLNGSFFRRNNTGNDGNEKIENNQVVISERTSRWTWALLARLPERGELDHQDVGVVRELGKRAVLLMRTLAEIRALQEVNTEIDYHPSSWSGIHEESDIDDIPETEIKGRMAKEEEKKRKRKKRRRSSQWLR